MNNYMGYSNGIFNKVCKTIHHQWISVQWLVINQLLSKSHVYRGTKTSGNYAFDLEMTLNTNTTTNLQQKLPLLNNWIYVSLD